ncbi:O-succinylbenzoate-CoA synthase [Microbispora hainanensis]|uniref:enolase C-terminal domain-like protein n=1 Tax=Microbispora TaxID=2005 RepID=UPI001157205A|nr:MULTISPECIES: enolase C-terminal domain-like protein [Microbispora]NJP23236.1 O-succinylbenzoate-CoA synthase [Microbispora sp. CL1-1]TQS16319.1 O-succinylbenzoate-CoA synthase [Microbispora sp. SCL1-1]
MPRVRELEVFRMTLPYGRRPETVLVKITDYGGMVGWGEAVDPAEAGPLERALPALIGIDWEHPSELGEIPGGAAGDMACWDLWGRMNGVPLSHALGGSRTSLIATVRLSADRSLESMVARVNRHVCAGYGHVTLDVHPGWDVEPLRAVRAAYPGLAIAVDGRGAYTEIAQLEALDAYGVVAIERPFKDLLTSADLQDRVSAQVAVEVASVAELDEAVSLNAGRALLLRPAKFGSLGAVRLAHDRAVEAGWDIVCAGGLGAGLARAATVAVASLPGCSLPSDVAEPPKSAQVVLPPVGASGGVVAVPLTQPGLGHTVDEDRVRRMARASFRV